MYPIDMRVLSKLSVRWQNGNRKHTENLPDGIGVQRQDEEDRTVMRAKNTSTTKRKRNTLMTQKQPPSQERLYEDVQALHKALDEILPLFIADRGWGHRCVTEGIQVLSRHRELPTSITLVEEIETHVHSREETARKKQRLRAIAEIAHIAEDAGLYD